ncbi:T9SS type A sorting domain-containing protein [Flavobacteriaceae bacterium TP-CH-4]|uniref:T9SS type A sorting domain-containing protein n=1 Tax=Pelagihabitans pacificus TaxID=2696054 RepID=A0A967AS84_9FLAO|nr:T9SS type A sorting domain-containing protein [Pelagihabitans pacificus]NHF59154.1 T9SS type A sorting domain-containing protein [Pelagihabitans pacificus]
MKHSLLLVALCAFMYQGLAQNPPSQKIILYPNVANEHVNVQLDKGLVPSEISIMQMDGRTVQHLTETKGKSTISMDTSNIPDGMYIVAVNTATERLTSKLIIDHNGQNTIYSNSSTPPLFKDNGITSVKATAKSSVIVGSSVKKAFPSAEGFGKNTTGGRGGIVVEVTNLNNSGPGSLREALKMTGTRTIVFKVGGTINCSSYLSIPSGSGNVTIAGQTAPGGGITIKGAELRVSASNVIVRHLRIRPGSNVSGSNVNAVRVTPYGTDISNIIFDHVSVTWGVDKVFIIGAIYNGDNVSNVTVQNSIIGENIGSGMGFLLYKNTKNVSIQKNLLTHMRERNIRSSTSNANFEMINNVVYGFSYGTLPTYENHFDIIGNVYKTDPKVSTALQTIRLEASTNGKIGLTKAYIDDNVLDGSKVSVSSNISPYLQSSPIFDSGIVPMPVNEVEAYVLSDVGSSLTRDAVDERIIYEVKNRTGGLKSSTSAAGGYPSISNGTAYKDSDKDGMSDEWEALNGRDLRPTDILSIYKFNEFNVDQTQTSAANRYSALDAYLAYLAKDWHGFETIVAEEESTGTTMLKINGSDMPVSAYDSSQDLGSMEIMDSGNTLRLKGNAWKKSPINHNVTPNSILEFDLMVTGEGEIHGIGFDNDNALNGSDGQRFFQLAGTQGDFGKQTYKTYSGNGWHSFSIPVGEFFTGNFDNIIFVADKDSNGANQESYFRNIRFREGTSGNSGGGSLVDFNMSSYDPAQQDSGSFELQDSDGKLKLVGNAWKKTALDYTITPNTVVEFDLMVAGEGEIHGIGFDNDNVLNGSDGQRFFQLAGTQSSYGKQTYKTYSGNEWVSFSIPVGEFFTGNFKYLVFSGDKDNNGASQISYFKNVVFREN